MMRIDSHQHFWNYNPKEHIWMTEQMEVLKRDYLPHELNPLLEAMSFDGTVAVQARQTLEETEWLLELSDQNLFIQGVVGWVNLRSSDVESTLRRLSTHPKFKGVRHVIHDEPDDRFMLHPDFLRGLEKVSELGLTYDLLLFPRHLPIAAQVVAGFPNLKFVIDHIAKPNIKDQSLSSWARDLRHLASLPNLYCKVSGMVTEANWRTWNKEDFRRPLDLVFEYFGPDRLMIGSDWPVCTLAGDYGQVMGIVLDYLEHFPSRVREMVLGNNAVHFYRLGDEE